MTTTEQFGTTTFAAALLGLPILIAASHILFG